MKIEVNNEVKIPMIKVVANPKIGPEPNNANTTPDKKVVNCESKIEGSACLKPSEMAILSDLPWVN